MNNSKHAKTKTQKNAIPQGVASYNQKVETFLQSKSLTPIEQAAVKLFKDNAQRNKLSDKEYNIEVEKFNNLHGFFLYKKGKASETSQSDRYYNYINYPYIDTQAFRETMEKYRQYVYKYNKQVAEENRDIAEYNTTVKKSLTDDEKRQKIDFKKRNQKEFTRHYNELAHEDNLQERIIPKKRIQPVKYQTEVIFSVLLGFYSKQLKKRNGFHLEMNIPTSCKKSDMPKLKINYAAVAKHKIEDIARLDISKKTVQNHVKRLREAGIFTNYIFINHKRPVLTQFNTEILTVLDGNLPKSLTSQNELLTEDSEKVLHNKVIAFTGTSKIKEKIKDFADSKDEKGTASLRLPSLQSPAEGYGNTMRARCEIPNGGGGNFSQNKNKIELLTDNFMLKLQDEQQLAELLATNYYEKYKGLRYDYLKKVAMYGLVSSEEFKEVLIQDFIKSSAKIWKKHNVYVGEWKKTINYLKGEIFKGMTQKETMINKLREYRWKLEFARKWFAKHKEFKALYPSAYFDRTREKSFEVGFFGLHKFWRKHLEIIQSKENEKKEAVRTGNQRKRRLSAQKKFGNAILKFHLGKMSFNELFDYVQNNLPEEYLPLLANSINNNLA